MIGKEFVLHTLFNAWCVGVLSLQAVTLLHMTHRVDEFDILIEADQHLVSCHPCPDSLRLLDPLANQLVSNIHFQDVVPCRLPAAHHHSFLQGRSSCSRPLFRHLRDDCFCHLPEEHVVFTVVLPPGFWICPAPSQCTVARCWACIILVGLIGVCVVGLCLIGFWFVLC